MSVIESVLLKSLSKTLKVVLGESRVKLRFVALTKSAEPFPLENEKEEEEEKQKNYADQFYLCMGEHALYLVTYDMSVALIKGGVSYDKLESIVQDESKENLFEIKLSGGVFDLKDNKHSSLKLLSYDRNRIMNRLQMYWRTHYMYTTWKVPDLTTECTIQRGSVNAETQSGSDFFSRAFKECPDDEVELTVSDYVFWADDSFRPRSREGSFFSKEYGRLKVRLCPEGSVLHLKHSKNFSIKAVADEEIAKVTSQVSSFVFVGQPCFYRKKYNLTHDKAQWTAWCAHLRTGASKSTSSTKIAENRDVIIIAARRKYIPPIMANYQDFVFTFYSKNWLKKKENDIVARGERAFRLCTGMYDSLRTKALQDFDYDYNVLQTKADTLWLDEDASMHFQATLLLQPSGYDRARHFVLSLLRIMYSLLNEPRYQQDTEEQRLTNDDPFKHVDELMKRTNGLTQRSDRKLYEMWKVRVWRYLAFCVDGNLRGLTNATISIADVAQKIVTAGQEHRAEQKKLSTILNYLLHFRLKGTPYSGDSVLDVYDRAGLMDEFEFNEIVLVKLLKVGYFNRFVFAEKGVDRNKYPGFLIRLLRQCTETPIRMAVTREVQAALCLQLLTLSSAYKENSFGRSRSSARAADEVAALIVLPEVVKLLRKHKDDVIKTHLMATLVNLTYGNDNKKKEVMRHDVPVIANQCLKSHDPDLVRQSCMLLANLTTTKTGCKAVGMVNEGRGDIDDNIITNLAMLLEKREYPPYERSVVVRFEAMKVLQNLSKDQSLHSNMVDCLPRRMRSFTGDSGSPFLNKLADLFDVRESKSGSDNKRVKSLLMAVCTCLIRLCYKHNDRKKSVGRMCIPSLVRLLSDGISKRNPELTIKVLMLCCSLAFDPSKENLSRFKKCDFNKTLTEVKLYRSISKRGSDKHQELIEKLIVDIHKAHKKHS